MPNHFLRSVALLVISALLADPAYSIVPDRSLRSPASTCHPVQRLIFNESALTLRLSQFFQRTMTPHPASIQVVKLAHPHLQRHRRDALSTQDSESRGIDWSRSGGWTDDEMKRAARRAVRDHFEDNRVILVGWGDILSQSRWFNLFLKLTADEITADILASHALDALRESKKRIDVKDRRAPTDGSVLKASLLRELNNVRYLSGSTQANRNLWPTWTPALRGWLMKIGQAVRRDPLIAILPLFFVIAGFVRWPEVMPGLSSSLSDLHAKPLLASRNSWIMLSASAVLGALESQILSRHFLKRKSGSFHEDKTIRTWKYWLSVPVIALVWISFSRIDESSGLLIAGLGGLNLGGLVSNLLDMHRHGGVHNFIPIPRRLAHFIDRHTANRLKQDPHKRIHASAGDYFHLVGMASGLAVVGAWLIRLTWTHPDPERVLSLLAYLVFTWYSPKLLLLLMNRTSLDSMPPRQPVNPKFLHAA